MRVSRAPEKRGGTNKILLYLSLVVTVIIVGILIAYFTAGFESRSATGDQTGLTELAASRVCGCFRPHGGGIEQRIGVGFASVDRQR